MSNRAPFLKLAGLVLLFLGFAAVGVWWLKIHDFNIRVSIDAGIDLLRSTGPVVFFLAMAVLPSLGVPVTLFYLAAASAFAAQLTLAGVLAASGAALAVNLALSYWLARYGLRPWLEAQIRKTKYRIPQIAPSEHAEITLIIRITPGPPFALQGILLGLAEVKFFTYMWISWVVAFALASGMIVFGDAILHGKGRLAFFGLSAIVGVSMIVHFLRRHYGKKRA